jgi:hypothetical protein
MRPLNSTDVDAAVSGFIFAGDQISRCLNAMSLCCPAGSSRYWDWPDGHQMVVDIVPMAVYRAILIGLVSEGESR